MVFSVVSKCFAVKFMTTAVISAPLSIPFKGVVRSQPKALNVSHLVDLTAVSLPIDDAALPLDQDNCLPGHGHMVAAFESLKSNNFLQDVDPSCHHLTRSLLILSTLLLLTLILLPLTSVSLLQTLHARLADFGIPCEEALDIVRLHHRAKLDLVLILNLVFALTVAIRSPNEDW